VSFWKCTAVLSFRRKEPRRKITSVREFIQRLTHEASEEEGGTMKFASKMAIAIVLILVGFAAGFPIGRSSGFMTGSEWALVQADIAAREAGVFMPVYLKDDDFRIVIRQPRNLHRKARKLAERLDDQTEANYKVSSLREKKQ
jgi:hypothetical protein